MAYIGSHPTSAPTRPLGSLMAGIAGFRAAFARYRQQRAVYLRTLRELQSYQPHELHDIRIQPSDFEELARKQAGW